MWWICNTGGEVMRWLQTDAGLRELLCDEALKLYAGEIRPSVEDDMVNMFPIACQFVALSVRSFGRVFKCLLWEHILCAELAVVQNRDCLDSFFFLARWKMPSFSSIYVSLIIIPWMTAFSSVWMMVTQAQAICGISELLWLRAACRIRSYLSSGRVHCPNEFL